MATNTPSKRNAILIADSLTLSGDITAPSYNNSNWDTAYGWGDHSTQNYATQTYVNNAVSNLVDSSPSTLDTLNELAAALGDDPNFATTVTNSIGTKWTQNNTKISNWDTAYGWGNHASAGYLTSFDITTQTDPKYLRSDVADTTSSRIDFRAGITSQTLDIGYTGDRTIQALSNDLTFGTYGDLHLQHYGGDLHMVHGGGIMYDNGNRVFSNRYHPNADKWTTARTITLSGDLNGSVSIDGSANVTLSGQVVNDSHTHDGRYYTESQVNTYINRSFVSSHTAGNLAVGWYTIATNTGDRASARFGIWDTAGGRHQSVTFYASHHFGTNSSNTLTVLDNSYYSGNPFRYIRIKDASTYDGAALQVYIDDSSNSINAAILGDNFQSGGWVLCDWIPDATTPPNVSNYGNFGERSRVDLNSIAQGGFATTGEIYAGGDTSQYRVFHDAFHPNADKWTTARSHTVTLTGDVTGSATQSVDGTGNKTWSLSTTIGDDSHFHHRLDSTDDRDVKPNTTGIGGNVQAIKPFFTSLGGMTGSANSNYQDLLVLDTYSDTSGGNVNAITMDKSDGSMRIWNAGQNATTWNTGQRIFADNYHPNADKWTTARTHTVTLTGDVTGTASQSVDGTGNKTWTINTNVGDADTLDGLHASSFWQNSGSWRGIHTDKTRVRGISYGGGEVWFGYAGGKGYVIADGEYYANEGNSRVFHDTYHPNADKWTTARTNTVTLTGDATGSGSASVDGSGNWTVSVPVDIKTYKGQNNDYVESSTSTANRGNFGAGVWAYSGYSAGDNRPFTYDATLQVMPTSGMGFEIAADWLSKTNTPLKVRSLRDCCQGWSSWINIFTDGYHPNADKWTTARTLSLTGDVTGSVSWDGSSNASITTVVANDSHNHNHSDGEFTVNGTLLINGGYMLRMDRSGGDAHQRADARLDGSNQARLHWYGKRDDQGTSNFKHAWYDGNSYVNVTAENDGVTFGGALNPTSYKVNGTTIIDSSRTLTVGHINTSYGISLNNGNTDFRMYNNAGENVLYMRDLTNSQMLTTWRTDKFQVNKILQVDGNIQKGGTTIMDSSRNLTNIAQASISGKLYSTATDIIIDTPYARTLWYDRSYGARLIQQAWASGIGDHITIRAGGNGTNVDHKFGEAGADLGGYLKIGGTTVIDSSRNLTNIGSITTLSSATSDMFWLERNDTSGITSTLRNNTGGNTLRLYGDYANNGSLCELQIQAGQNGDYAQVGTWTNQSLYLKTNNSNKVEVDNVGNFKVLSGDYKVGGTTVISGGRNLVNINQSTIAYGLFTTYWNSTPPSNQTNISGYGLQGNRTSPFYIHNYGYGGVRIGSTGALGSANGMLIYSNSATMSGTFTATSNITAYSDRRLKDNIKTLDGSKVYEMRGVSFTKDGELGSGVIAQELEQVAPELVLTNDDEMQTKSVAYGNVVGYLIEAIKELKSEIEELKNGNNTN